jgi:hypothetical protein
MPFFAYSLYILTIINFFLLQRLTKFQKIKLYSSEVVRKFFFVYTKLPESSFNKDFAKDKALLACIFALLTHVEYLEFVFDFDVRFLGTAIFFFFMLLFL